MAESPAYYTRGKVETWDFIRDQELNYHLGCAIKYIVRAGYKDDAKKDLEKAIHYLENELHHLQESARRSFGVPSIVRYPEWEEPDGDPAIFDR